MRLQVAPRGVIEEEDTSMSDEKRLEKIIEDFEIVQIVCLVVHAFNKYLQRMNNGLVRLQSVQRVAGIRNRCMKYRR